MRSRRPSLADSLAGTHPLRPLGRLDGVELPLGAMEARLTWRMVLVAGAVTALVAGLDRLLA